jgi:hypothetical protein
MSTPTSPVATTCPACGKPGAPVTTARNPGQAVAPKPLLPDASWQQPTGFFGIWSWYVISCANCRAKTLINDLEFSVIVGQQPPARAEAPPPPPPPVVEYLRVAPGSGTSIPPAAGAAVLAVDPGSGTQVPAAGVLDPRAGTALIPVK